MEGQVQQQVQAIEGITPAMLWTFLVVLVGLMALVVLGDKVADVFRKAKKRKKEETELTETDITDRIADKVMEKLQPKLDEKFAEIDRKLANDRSDIVLQTNQLNATTARVDRLDNDNKALLHGMSALLSHSISGNSTDRLKKTQTALNNYLIDGIYKEDEWA
jgi:hypothetical protein